MHLHLTTLLLALAASVPASVAGSPYSEHVGPTPNGYLEYQNDDFKPHAADDYFTAGAHGGARFGDFALGADYRILTMKRAHNRADQFATTLGYDFAPRQDTILAVGVGVIAIGDIAGQKIQNWWHRTDLQGNTPDVMLTYSPHHYMSPLLTVDVRKAWVVMDEASIAIDGSASAHRVGGDLDARVLWAHENHMWDTLFVAWIGPGIMGHYGNGASPAVDEVNHCYTGLTFNAGLRLSSACFSLQVARTVGFGSVGFTF